MKVLKHTWHLTTFTTWMNLWFKRVHWSTKFPKINTIQSGPGNHHNSNWLQPAAPPWFNIFSATSFPASRKPPMNQRITKHQAQLDHDRMFLLGRGSIPILLIIWLAQSIQFIWWTELQCLNLPNWCWILSMKHFSMNVPWGWQLTHLLTTMASPRKSHRNEVCCLAKWKRSCTN